MTYEACVELIPLDNKSSVSATSSDRPARYESVISLGERITLGKDKANTVRLGCALGSRQHCSLELIKKGDGQPRLVLRDSSTNGVFLNRERVKGKRVLANGDELHVQLAQTADGDGVRKKLPEVGWKISLERFDAASSDAGQDAEASVASSDGSVDMFAPPTPAGAKTSATKKRDIIAKPPKVPADAQAKTNNVAGKEVSRGRQGKVGTWQITDPSAVPVPGSSVPSRTMSAASSVRSLSECATPLLVEGSNDGVVRNVRVEDKCVVCV